MKDYLDDELEKCENEIDEPEIKLFSENSRHLTDLCFNCNKKNTDTRENIYEYNTKPSDKYIVTVIYCNNCKAISSAQTYQKVGLN